MKNISIPSMVANMAAADVFLAPDSTARRPNPQTMEDRPRTPLQVPSTALESDLPDEKESESDGAE